MENLVGYKAINFVSKNGEEVSGTMLYITYPDSSVTGKMADKLFIREGTLALPELSLGADLIITYNRKGKPVRIEAAPTKQISINK